MLRLAADLRIRVASPRRKDASARRSSDRTDGGRARRGPPWPRAEYADAEMRWQQALDRNRAHIDQGQDRRWPRDGEHAPVEKAVTRVAAQFDGRIVEKIGVDRRPVALRAEEDALADRAETLRILKRKQRFESGRSLFEDRHVAANDKRARFRGSRRAAGQKGFVLTPLRQTIEKRVVGEAEARRPRRLR